MLFSIFQGLLAHNGEKCLCKFTWILITHCCRNFNYTLVCFQQQLCSFVHFVFFQIGVGCFAINLLESTFRVKLFTVGGLYPAGGGTFLFSTDGKSCVYQLGSIHTGGLLVQLIIGLCVR